MKKLACSLILLVCFGFAVPALAAEEPKDLGFWFETQVASNGFQRAIAWYQKDWNESFGFFAFASAESGDYRQAYAGPTWKPFQWLQVGVGVGMENIPSSTRYGTFVDFNYWKEVNIFGIFEIGKNGPWHKITATYKAHEKIGVGLMDETGFGFGPRVEYNITKKTQVWCAVLRNHEGTGETATMFAINFSF